MAETFAEAGPQQFSPSPQVTACGFCVCFLIPLKFDRRIGGTAVKEPVMCYVIILGPIFMTPIH